jgi:hypothetical protein
MDFGGKARLAEQSDPVLVDGMEPEPPAGPVRPE